MKSKAVKIIASLAVVIIVAAGIIGYQYYQFVEGSNLTTVDGHCEIYIFPHSDFKDVSRILENSGCIKNLKSFHWVAEKMSYAHSSVRPGRYLLQDGMSNRQIIGKLRSGNQDAVNVTIVPARDLTMVAERASRNIVSDSLSIINFFYSEELTEKFGLDVTSLKARILPNTYRMWWTTKPPDLVERLLTEYDRFWNKMDRKSKAESLGLTPEQVIILASIVESETNYVLEMPAIAGVYLNRIQSGWLLQADPTVVFALGDPTIRRVLTRDLEVDSPYNTYKYPGLPPGPINIPSLNAIEAVLNPQQHDYFYFCAKPDNSGTHVFSKTLAAHLNNARQFQNWLNRQRIMR